MLNRPTDWPKYRDGNVKSPARFRAGDFTFCRSGEAKAVPHRQRKSHHCGHGLSGSERVSQAAAPGARRRIGAVLAVKQQRRHS